MDYTSFFQSIEDDENRKQAEPEEWAEWTIKSEADRSDTKNMNAYLVSTPDIKAVIWAQTEYQAIEGAKAHWGDSVKVKASPSRDSVKPMFPARNGFLAYSYR